MCVLRWGRALSGRGRRVESCSRVLLVHVRANGASNESPKQLWYNVNLCENALAPVADAEHGNCVWLCQDVMTILEHCSVSRRFLARTVLVPVLARQCRSKCLEIGRIRVSRSGYALSTGFTVRPVSRSVGKGIFPSFASPTSKPPDTDSSTPQHHPEPIGVLGDSGPRRGEQDAEIGSTAKLKAGLCFSGK
jgi:hypothetical protein